MVSVVGDSVARMTISVLRRRRVAATIRGLLASRAVIIDTETTDLDGYAVEIAAVDLLTGEVLVDTLINPRAPICAGAQAVHGIGPTDVERAPSWPQIAHEVAGIAAGKTVIAYNHHYDRAVLDREARRSGAPMIPTIDWVCAMRLRADYEGVDRWRRLDGGHRAVGDCQATRDLLLAMLWQTH